MIMWKDTGSRVNISRVNKQSKDNMNINIIDKYNALWCDNENIELK